MRHKIAQRKFGRKTDERRALLRSLAEGLIENGMMTTTEAKAKETRRFVEKLITLANRGTLASRRLVVSRLGTERRAHKLLSEIAPRYKERPGGYTRITKLPAREGDASPMAMIEFV